MRNLADINDVAHIEKHYGKPLASKPCPQDPVTGKINPQATEFYYGKKTRTVTHVKPVYYEHAKSADTNLVFRPMYEVCEHYGNHLVVFKYEKLHQVHPRYVEWLRKRMELIGGQVLVTSPFSEKPAQYNYITEVVHNAVAKPTVGLTVTTVYPDPDTETTTVDGYITTSSGSWATARGATTGTANDNAADTGSNIQASDYLGTKYLGRGFFLFDTSSIPDSDSIDSVLFSQYMFGGSADADTTTYEVVETTPASNTSLTGADFNNLTFTSGGSRSVAPTTGAYTDITMDATGRGWVNVTGVTKLGLILGLDLSNTDPTGLNRDNFYFADQSGTANDPKLTVTHSAGATAHTKDLNETTTLTVSIQKDTTKTYADSTTITDAISNLRVLLQELAETITITASLGSKAITKAWAETLTITDTIAKELAKILAEAVTITASAVALTATYTKIITESITVTATLAKLSGFARSITENITITERFYGLLNGVNMHYVDSYTDTVDDYVDQYFNV